MAISTARRPFPAMVFIAVLFAITAVVWWRVLNRPDSSPDSPQTSPTKVQTCASHGAKPLSLPTPKSVTVVVLNGAGRDLLATQVSGQLKSRGFKVGAPGDAPSPSTGTAEIEYGKSGKAAATLLAFYLPGSKIVSTNRSDATLNLILGSSYRSLASPTTVSQAIARAKKPC